MILLLSGVSLLPLRVNGCVFWQTFQKYFLWIPETQKRRVWLAMFSATKVCVFDHSSCGRNKTNLSISQDKVMCSMAYLEPVRMAVLCVLPCREHQRNGKRRGKGLPWWWAHTAVYTQALVLPLFVFPCVFVSEAPLQLAGQHMVLEKGFLSVFLELIKMACQFYSYSKQLCHFYTCKSVCEEYAKIVCAKLREDFWS